jgi:hypothetical protein
MDVVLVPRQPGKHFIWPGYDIGHKFEVADIQHPVPERPVQLEMMVRGRTLFRTGHNPLETMSRGQLFWLSRVIARCYLISSALHVYPSAEPYTKSVSRPQLSEREGGKLSGEEGTSQGQSLLHTPLDHRPQVLDAGGRRFCGFDSHEPQRIRCEL